MEIKSTICDQLNVEKTGASEGFTPWASDSVQPNYPAALVDFTLDLKNPPRS